MEAEMDSTFSLVAADPEQSEPMSEQLCDDDPLAQEVAMALFDAGIAVAAMTWRRGKMTTGPHFSKMHRLVLHLRGEMTIQLGKKRYDLKPGDLVYCAPGTAFRYLGTEELAYWLYFYIRPTPFWESLATGGSYVGPYPSARLMHLLLRRILDAHRDRGPANLSMARGDAHMLHTVLRRLRRLPPKRPDVRAVKLRELIHEITQTPAKAWTAMLMAERLHVSESTLLRLCKRHYDRTTKEVIIHQRLDVADRLLVQTDDPLAVIASRVGYLSVCSFSRLFSKYRGIAPSRYRERALRLPNDEVLPSD